MEGHDLTDKERIALVKQMLSGLPAHHRIEILKQMVLAMPVQQQIEFALWIYTQANKSLYKIDEITTDLSSINLCQLGDFLVHFSHSFEVRIPRDYSIVCYS
jgi:hypothetical protein